ncbi:MAG: exodeoxyribonuclease VII small subunit [Cytophagaceae bacterium]|jgi:exodeoxyribonuclease VII small subunit|nr:exodeoxyribonuclease VII small subunit [Cytophagaceae bacterium]
MKKISYTEAYEELKKIVQEMEEGKISVDELSEKVKRATMLIGICKEKLHATEQDIQEIMKDLDSE